MVQSTRNKKTRHVPAVFLLLFLIIGSLNAQGLGLGVSPGAIEFKDVLRSGYAEKTVTLSTSSDEPITCHVTAEGAFRNWLKYEPGETFVIPPRSQVKLKIIVQPPEDIQNGAFDGFVVIAIVPKSTGAGGGMGSSVSAAVSVRSTVHVSDVEKKHFFLLSDPTVVDTEETKPIDFYFSFENDGNVRVNPKIHIDILGGDKTTILKSFDYSDKLLLPTTRADVLVTSSNDLPIGKYWAHIKIYQDSDVVGEYTLSFEVLERGSLNIKGQLVKVELNKIWVYAGEIVEINATFENDGVRPTTAVFNGKAMLGDTVDALINSDEVEVAPGQISVLSSYYTPKKAGRYSIVGKVSYSKKLTEEKSSILNVRDASEKPIATTTTIADTGLSGGGMDMVQIGAVILVFAVVVGFVLWRMKKSSGKKGDGDEYSEVTGKPSTKSG